MPIYKQQKRKASSYASLQRFYYSEMNEEPSTMKISVYDFNEEDHPKEDIFRHVFCHGGTPFGKQENSGKSVVSTSRKKQKLTAKKLPKKKPRRPKTAIEANRKRSSSASDSIEGYDSDSELNQNRMKLEMRFGETDIGAGGISCLNTWRHEADDSDSESNQNERKLEMSLGEMDTGALGISCLNTHKDEDHVAEESREVVMHGKELLFLEQCCRSPEFIFTPDGIVLKIRSMGAVGTVKWALQEITSFGSYFDPNEGLAFIELSLTEQGVRTFLRALGQTDNYWSHQTLSSSLSINSSSWENNMKEITALSDVHRKLWCHGKEDMSKRFQQSMESILRRQDLENQPFFVDCIACDRNRAMSDNWFDLIYPTKEDHDAVTVTQYDFLLLNPDQFLSDTIIDFYIKYLQSLLSEKENKRFYFYNSFFFRKLTEVDKNLQHGLEKRKSSFERVKRWTAKINIFEKDYLFIPIMQSAHWSLVIVCHPGMLSADREDACDPMILHFDSLEGCHTGVEEPIRNYLMEAWNERNGPSEDSESLSTLKFVEMKAPQQTNYSDCGLFLLHYVELFIKEISNKDSIEFATDGWFNPAEASNKRAAIQSLIESLKAKESSEKLGESWCQRPSNVTGSPDGVWSAQRLGLSEVKYLKTTNLFPGNMPDQGCSTLTSYPQQQYQHNLPVWAHTTFRGDHVVSGLDLEQLLAAKELQDCFCHGQSQSPIGKFSIHCHLQEGAVNHEQDIFIPGCTCLDKDCAVHHFDLTSPRDSLEGTTYNENVEDFHTLSSDDVINAPDEFTEVLDNNASGFTMVETNFTKLGSFENNGADAKAFLGFSLHYDAKRVSDMGTSTMQKLSLDDRPDAHAFKIGRESPHDDSFTEQVAKSNIEPNEGFLGAKFGDLKPKILLTNSSGGFTHLEGKESILAVNRCAKDKVLQSEGETYGGDAIQRESLTECANPPEVSYESSPLVEERTTLDIPLHICADELMPNAAGQSKVRKRGRASGRSNSDQLTPATRRVTRSASKQ